MSDIKWIKISTSMFDDEKIKIIEQMPDADTLLVIWMKLLTLAGKANAGGFMMLTESIPYTEDMLVAIVNRPLSTVRIALKAFQEFGMLEKVEDGRFYLSNWDKHQNVEKMEQIRVQTRKRVAEHRERQKQLTCSVTGNKEVTPCNATCNVTVTECNATDKELDKDLKHKKIKYAEFVSMTEQEHQKLVDQYGREKTERFITVLDNYAGSTGKEYKSDYRAILNWVVKRVEEEEEQHASRPSGSAQHFGRRQAPDQTNHADNQTGRYTEATSITHKQGARPTRTKRSDNDIFVRG